MFRSKIFQNLFWISTSLIVVSIVTVGALSYMVFENRLHQEIEQLLQNETAAIQRFYQSQPGLDFSRSPFVDPKDPANSHRVTVISDTGEVLFDSQNNYLEMDNHLNRPEIKSAASEHWGRSKRYSATLKKDFLYVAKLVEIDGQSFFVRVARPVELINRDLSYVVWTFILMGICIMLIASMLMYLSIRKPLLAISDIIAVAKQLMQGQYHVRVHNVINVQGEIALLSNTMNHLASHLQSQIQSLKDAEKKVVDILTHLKDALVVIDTDNNVVLDNHAWLDLFGESVGNQQKTAGFDHIRNKKIQDMVEAARKSKVLQQDVVVVEADKTVELYFTQSFLVELQSETLTVVTMSNITEIKRAEEMKRDFIANASHQLKTPMAAIQGYAETLLDIDGITKDKQDEYLEKILQRSRLASEMIVKLLTLTKVEDSFAYQQVERVDLADLLVVVVDKHEVALQKQGITVSYDLPAQGLSIVSYPQLLEIMLSAIIENAIAYSPLNTTIDIAFYRKAEKVCIAIHDHGIGMREEEKERIFERFYRTEKAQMTYVNGTGIGLALVAECLARMHGGISVESAVGKGTTFLIALPMDKNSG